jgi:hypothetical protein
MSRHRIAREASVLTRLHRSLVAETSRPSSASTFSSLRERQHALASFESVPALIEHLADRDAPALLRNERLAALIAGARTAGAVGRLSTAILWLALWPGLTTLFMRERRRVGDDDELLSRIAVHFAEHLARVEGTRVTKLAATLLLDTRRSLRAEREREACAAIDVVDPADSAPDVAADVDLSTLHGEVAAVVGRDADLVLARVIGRTPFAEIAVEAGVSEDAARKRLTRAVERLRHSFTAR